MGSTTHLVTPGETRGVLSEEYCLRQMGSTTHLVTPGETRGGSYQRSNVTHRGDLPTWGLQVRQGGSLIRGVMSHTEGL